MRTWIIVNPKAGSAEDAGQVEQWAAARDGVTVHESSGEAACRRLVHEAVAENVDQVVAAGGDGTVNLVVNALLAAEADVQLGVLPLGTGNDLAHTLDLPREMSGALEVLETGREQSIDAFRLEAGDVSRYGVNAAAGGFSGQVDEALTSEMKATWGPLAYILGVAQVLPDLHEYETFIATEGQSRERVEAINIVVANGRTAGGGRPVAPVANPCDGLLDVVIVKWGRADQLAEVGTRLMAGNYLESQLVTHQRVQTITVSSSPGMWFNVDGELVTKKPVTIRVLPGRLRVVVGPEFQAVVSSA